jgi:hypothetical protein
MAFEMLTADVDVLRDVHIVDTPGTNAIIREHERLTSEFVPRSDLGALRDVGRPAVHLKPSAGSCS